jgi:hypothetical protein
LPKHFGRAPGDFAEKVDDEDPTLVIQCAEELVVGRMASDQRELLQRVLELAKHHINSAQ